MTLKVFILAKYEPLRVGLVQILTGRSDIEVVGDAASLEALIGYARSRQAEVFVVDVQTIVAELEVLPRLEDWLHLQKVIFLGRLPGEVIRPETIQILIQLRSFGFLSTDGSAGMLADAIRLVSAGVFVCDVDVIKPMFLRLQRWSRGVASGQDVRQDRLTSRELEVLSLVAEGMSNSSIARQLVLSEGTIKAHISHIMAKLGIGQRAGLVRYAVGRDIVTLPPESQE